MAFNVKKHDKVLQRTLDSIDADTFDSVKSLENEVAELVAQGLPVDLVRPQIIAAFNRNSQTVRSVAQPLSDISNDLIAQSKYPGTIEDNTTANTLIQTSSDSLSKTFQSADEDVVSTVVLATVAGLAITQIVESARARISGIQMETNDPSIRSMQRKLRKMQLTPGVPAEDLSKLAAQIKSKLPKTVNTSASLAVLMSTVVDKVVGSFDGAFAKARATRLGIEKFTYSGSIIESSRPFCMEMLGEELTIDEIQSIWSSRSWAGKEPGDAFVVRGGYNCRHYWMPNE